MKKIIIILAALTVGFTACKKKDFSDSYADPSKISVSTVEKQYAGFLQSNWSYVVPDYWNYFVVLRTTITHYTQAVGFVNATNQYVPGEAGIGSRWSNYYNFLAQYRELEKIYANLSDADKALYRVYMITAAVYFYDHTQKVVDLHGDIPWSKAGMLSANGGDYTKSLPAYDGAEAIYTKMLDDLKAFSDELSTLTVSAGVQTGFTTQDIINKGSVTMWQKYCNSLRIRMLTRVSGVSAFSSRAATEIAGILGNPSKYPVIATNADNAQLKIYNLSSPITASGFRTGLEDWNGNLAGKVMIDHMKANSDPRLRVLFEPGANAAGVYTGLDPLLNSGLQNNLVNAGTLAIYNRSTLSRNQFFPGVLINAAEVSFLVAEAALKANNLPAAKAAYEDGIRKSVEFYYYLRSISNDNTVAAPTPATPTEVNTYIASANINWDNAATNAARLNLIATQKWIHYNVVEPTETWAELRRLDLPALSFEVDNGNAQKTPPYRWLYAAGEKTYNTENYNAVSAKDNLTTKLFWDLQ